jgi:RND superfamily putative drug exporter
MFGFARRPGMLAEGTLARIGRWSFRRRWWVLIMWLVVAAAGIGSVGPVFDSLEHSRPTHLESFAAKEALGTADDPGPVTALVDQVDPAAPGVAEVVTRIAADLDGRADVRRVEHPFTTQPAPGRRSFLAGDGRGLLMVATLATIQDGHARSEAIDAVSARMRHLGDELRAAGQPTARVRIGGAAALDREIHRTIEADLARAELWSLPITLVVLVVVFGGLIAAGIPVLAALVSAATAMILLLGFSRVTELGDDVVTVVTLLGLGLSIDYALLLVGRYREEVAAGHPPETAVGLAWATAGRTIAYSALTVAAALSGLLVFGLPGISLIGLAGVSIALIAVTVALTLTAGLLGLAHRRIRPAARAANRRAWADATDEAVESGFFARLVRLVQHRPVVVTVATAALLLLAGAPLLHTSVKVPHLEQVPRSIESAQVADELAARFGQSQRPAVIVVARAAPAALDTWASRWNADATVRPAVDAGSGLSTVRLIVAGDDSQSATAQDLVLRIRADRPAGVRSWVTGDAATLVDVTADIREDLPWAIAVALTAMLILLFGMTGSVVVPIKAILTNLLSLGAAFGVMNAVFVQGWLAGPLDTVTVSGLDPFVLVTVFAFSFALSMDYEVFLLARIKEYVDHGTDTDTAVRRGLHHTGQIITSAALLMVIVFGGFAAARIGNIEQIGLGLAVAVLIDATIVRCLLVPATMTLLGQWNWWAPAPLQRLHHRVTRRERSLPPLSGADRPTEFTYR